MKEKNNRDLTSRERKELCRQADDPKPVEKPAMSEEEVLSVQKRRRILAVVVLVVAVILLAVGIFVPTYMSCTYMFEGNPVAEIKLKAGNKSYTLKYELFVKDAPAAVANFAFLASIDYFDGAIIYDTQNEWVRFGGYRLAENEDGTVSYTHLADDESYTTKWLDNFTEERYEDDDHSGIFKYRLKSENTTVNYYDSNMQYALCFNNRTSSQAATEFQISGSTKQRKDQLKKEDTTTLVTFSTNVFGLPLNSDKETQEAIDYILSLEQSSQIINKYFKTPIDEKVIISDVKVYNYSKEWMQSKYEYGFESYMTEIGGFYNTSSGTWTRSHI